MDPIKACLAQLNECTTWDSGVLKRRLFGFRKQSDKQHRFARYEQEFAELIAQSQAVVTQRQAQRPTLEYPEQLPVVQQRDVLIDAIASHQVVIIAGETGSGKTTQLPKICLELGRGVRGLIGHTQPRRLAARSVAQRIAEELNEPLGKSVGYKVRFDEQFSREGYVKLMTDGILLNEIQHDPWLNDYDTLIIDEAHERSLNIDFILGYLKQLLPRRPDLKLIITSATIDPERFAKHFNDAPVFEVSGRTFPVEMRYRPLLDEEGEATRDLEQGILDAIDELVAEGGLGDILIFMNGEREIRDLTQTLNRQQYRDTEILPLYARLAGHEQQRIFSRHSGRRIVIATNVAETSLTVPGIRYVIDPGTARLSRYSARAKVQRLPIEAISQASARQRAGRCGRVAAGICIRLYSEEDFNQRPAFTDPEILRTNLASVILQMASLGLGEIEAFPFVEPPDTRNISDGINLLQELGAVTAKQRHVRLTKLGRELSRLPIDPRLGRMLLEARQQACLEEITVIVAALSIQDPRERPLEKQQAADQAHSKWRDKESDFNALVNLWQGLREARGERSANQFRHWCRDQFINYLRVREWQDLYSQLRGQMRELGGRYNREPGNYTNIHQALASGLLSQIGTLSKNNEYLGSRNSKFWIFPGSGVKKTPKWVMAAELTETSRLFARTVAKIDPTWLESLAQHLVKRSYSEPHFSKKRQEVVASETQMLYGLPIVAQRTISYGRINAGEASDIFIRQALVERELVSRLPWWQRNQQVLADIEAQEARLRRRDVLIDDERLYQWYRQKLPQTVFNRHTLEHWSKKHPDQAKLMAFSEQDVTASAVDEQALAQYPQHWQIGELDLKLHYAFEPGSERDGVLVDVPLALLNQLDESEFAWQVPGMREELIITMIRSLPKSLRRMFVPAPDVAKRIVARINPEQGTLIQAVTKELQRIAGQPLDPEAMWQGLTLPSHLRLKFRLLDAKGKELALSDNLAELRRGYKKQVQQLVERSVDDDLPTLGSEGEWLFDTLPPSLVRQQPGYQITLYPALRDRQQRVVLEYLDNPEQARDVHHDGVRRLLLLSIPSPRRHLENRLPNKAKLTMYYNPLGTVGELLDDLINAATDAVLPELVTIRDATAFVQARDRLRADLNERAEHIARQVEGILLVAHQLRRQLKGKVPFELVMQYGDIRQQLDKLIFKGFISATGPERLGHLQRYMDALVRRLEKLTIDPHKDRRQMQIIQDLEQRYQQLSERPQLQKQARQSLTDVYWQLQELRVSYFAQQLGTQGPVSDKRVSQALDELAKLAR